MKDKLEDKLEAKFDEFGLVRTQRDSLNVYLELIRKRDEETWEHSVRVGLLGAEVAQFTNIIEPKGLFYPGLLHDVGKTLVNPASLKKKKDFGPKDMEELKKHVMYGYRMLRGIHDFSARVLLFHHYFQENGYPHAIPSEEIDLSKGTDALILYCGRLLSLVDFYDAASNRKNEKFTKDISEAPSHEKVKQTMLKFNFDQKYLIERLYSQGIF
ncbi:MAG: HD domain-containing protein [Candidatus Pacearchaeota archaeon]|jgi:HD-GYP domain-containing protein (c-di-GMP phosphodiesterase class II)